MKVYLVIDDEAYEHTDIIAAYTDAKMAKNRVARMKAALDAYDERQRNLESQGQSREFEKCPPHLCRNLYVRTIKVIPYRKKQRFTPAPDCAVNDAGSKKEG